MYVVSLSNSQITCRCAHSTVRSCVVTCCEITRHDLMRMRSAVIRKKDLLEIRAVRNVHVPPCPAHYHPTPFACSCLVTNQDIQHVSYEHVDDMCFVPSHPTPGLPPPAPLHSHHLPSPGCLAAAPPAAQKDRQTDKQTSASVSLHNQATVLQVHRHCKCSMVSGL